MRGLFRFVVLACLLCALVILGGASGLTRAQAPVSLKDRISGKWEMQDPPAQDLFITKVVVEFTPDKMKVTTTIKDKKQQKQAPANKDATREITDEATYKIHEPQKQLEITFTKPNGDKVTNTATIEVLDDKKLVTVNHKGQKTEFKRSK